jgi:uncharacterized protein YqgC (DUF456 family)
MLDYLTEFLGIAFPWVILIIMLFGWGGLVVPIFPGNVVIWGAALAYGLVTEFDPLGIWMFAFITLLMFLSVAADNLFMGAKAREAGASWQGIIIALVAGIVTSFFFTPLTGLVVAPVTLYINEYIRLKDSEEAIRITRGMVLGCGWAFVIRFGLGAIQIGLYAVWAFRG